MRIGILDDRANGGSRPFLDLDLVGSLEAGEISALRGLHPASLHRLHEITLHFREQRASNDVITVLRLYDRRYLARLERCCCLIEFLDHRAAREHAERSASRSRPGVLTVLFRELGEVGGVHLAAKRIDLLLDLSLPSRRRVGSEKQNVAGSEHASIVVRCLSLRAVGSLPRFRNLLVPFLRLDVGDHGPHRIVDFLVVLERIVVGCGLGDEMVVHPGIDDCVRDILSKRSR